MKNARPNFLLLIFSLLVVTMLFTTCKKDDDKELPSRIELLTAHEWIMTALTVDPDYPIYDERGYLIGYYYDIYALTDDCRKDDTRKFNKDKTFVDNTGIFSCQSSEPQTTSGKWSINADETILTIDEVGFSYPSVYTIVELTQDVLKIQSKDNGGAMNYTFTITFSH